MLSTVLMTVLLAGGPSAQDRPPVSNAHGAFAFPNATSSEMIVLHDVDQAGAFGRAACGERLLRIRFSRRQTGTGATHAVAREFNRLHGTIFSVLDERANPDDDCFVMSDALLEQSELIRVVPQASSPSECSADEQRRFAELRARRIKGCWSLAALQPRGTMGLVKYERMGRDALASLLIIWNDRAIVIDFPAQYRGAGQELWRAGDDGEFSPYGFLVPIIVRRGRSYFVPLAWSASEGTSLTLFVSDPGAPARVVLSDHWYRGPH